MAFGGGVGFGYPGGGGLNNDGTVVELYPGISLLQGVPFGFLNKTPEGVLEIVLPVKGTRGAPLGTILRNFGVFGGGNGKGFG